MVRQACPELAEGLTTNGEGRRISVLSPALLFSFFGVKVVIFMTDSTRIQPFFRDSPQPWTDAGDVIYFSGEIRRS